MTEKQAFKFAFLMGCASDGLDAAETAAAIARLNRALEKQANPILDAAKTLAGATIPVAVGGAAIAGGSLGYLAAKLREGSFDSDAAKKHELIAAYNSFADEAKHVGRSRKPPGSTIRIPLN